MTEADPSPDPIADSIAVRMSSITKRYLNVVANDRASLTVRRGEVHAVVGENGAGKSTLMKILYGLIAPDAGTIEVLGRPLAEHSSKAAIAAGLGMVFQHFMLVPALTVAENIVLGLEPTRGPWFDQRRAVEEVRALSQKFGLPIDPEARVESCSVGLQQRIEILKVLLRGAEVIILDEPTAVLTPQEVDELIVVIRRLAEQKKTIILITHKLREVMAAADRVTIMRRGETLQTLEVAKTTAGEIAERMIGRALETPERPSGAVPAGPPVLELRELCVASTRGRPAIDKLSFELRGGEILGIAGIEGNGQTELVECIAGLRSIDGGSIRLSGQALEGLGARERSDLGVAHIPEDRHKRAVVLDFDLTENAALGLQHRSQLASWWTMRFGALRRHVEAIINSADVRPPEPELPIRQLSGGNQQKLVIGRELSKQPKLLLASHPTRGLDVGASEFVHRALLAERARGAAVLFVSAELPELMALSDRVLVMFEGRAAGEVDPTQVDERKLGLMMAGSS